jgi:hypothetical protein
LDGVSEVYPVGSGRREDFTGLFEAFDVVEVFIWGYFQVEFKAVEVVEVSGW